MKTIQDLREILSKDIPSPFAAGADALSDFPDEATDDSTNFVTGIVQKYATGTGTGGSLMPRGDFNRIGEIASRELFFRQIGRGHSFSSDFSSVNDGYADGVVLFRDDGKFVLPVESTEGGNDLDFSRYPSTIGALANKPSDPDDAAPRVLWKPSASGYGLGFGGMDFAVDFSRRHDLTQGEALAEDSFVVIGYVCYGVGNVWHEEQGTSGHVKFVFSVGDPQITMTDVFTSKQGVMAGGLGLILPFGGPIYYARFFGTGNGGRAFFGRKGDKISWSLSLNGPNWQASGDRAFTYACSFPLMYHKTSHI